MRADILAAAAAYLAGAVYVLLHVGGCGGTWGCA